MATDELSRFDPSRPSRTLDGSGRTRVIAVANVLESVRQARASSDHTTARMVRQLQGSPLATLVSRGRIRMEELRAAEDIVSGFLSASAGFVGWQATKSRSSFLESGTPSAPSDAQARYAAFVQHWSRRAVLGDPSLAIVIAVVVDQHPFASVEEDIGLSRGKAAEAVVAVLRDYAARAGLVDPGSAQRWIIDAAQLFPVCGPE
jgi:hypothetical protein